MKSIKCPGCSLVQWADNQYCKRCGTAIGGFENLQEPMNPAANEYRRNPYVAHANPQLKTGLALASMIIGIVALPTMFLLVGLLMAPVAIVLGIVAIRKASKQPQIYGGKGFAIAGIVVSSLACLLVPIVAAIAIPNLLAARRAANEGSAVSAIRLIASAQEAHVEMDPDGECGDLMQLAAAKLIGQHLAGGKRSGYRFVSQGNVDDVNGCEIQATPESESQGRRSFYYSSSDGVLRVAVDGLAADHDDPPAESNRVSN